jgi:hypothetical protein
MKNSIFFFFATAFLTSCAVSNRIRPMNDSPNDLKHFGLTQVLETHSAENVASTKGRPDFKISSSYLFEEKKNRRPLVTVNFLILNQESTAKLQPDKFIELDNEKIRIDSDNKMKNQFNIIPENLWSSIIHAQKIGWILYSGKEAINLHISQLETTKLKEFFGQAIEQRDAKFPAIPPGHKKW